MVMDEESRPVDVELRELLVRFTTTVVSLCFRLRQMLTYNMCRLRFVPAVVCVIVVVAMVAQERRQVRAGRVLSKRR